MTYTPPEEVPFRLASMATPRKRRTGLIAAGIVTGVLVVAAIAGGVGYALADRGGATPAAAPAPVVSTDAASPSPSAGEKARRACERLVAASRVEDVYKAADLPGLKEAADAAGASDNTSIALSGLLLGDAIDTAIASRGQADEQKYLTSMAKYVRGLREDCAHAGFPA